MADDCVLPRTKPRTTVLTAKGHRILHEAELSPPQPIWTLARPQGDDFGASIPRTIDKARDILIQQRVCDPGYRPPEAQHRLTRLWNKKAPKTEAEAWKFTRHEVAKAFNALLCTSPLPEPAIAQAVLLHAPVASLRELWCHFLDPSFERKQTKRSLKERSLTLHRSVSTLVLRTRSSLSINNRSSATLSTNTAKFPYITWLDIICQKGNLKYMRLMCQVGLEQADLNRAFQNALEKRSLHAMELFLSYGSIATNACQNTIRECVRRQDIGSIRLLLSAPHVMTVDDWHSCLEFEIRNLGDDPRRSPDMLLLCKANPPELACSDILQDSLLQSALKVQSVSATAILLAYGFCGEVSDHTRQIMCQTTSQIHDDQQRQKLFALLAASEFLADNSILREELWKDVENRHFPLIRLLANAGVIIDVEPCNAFSLALSRLDFDVLELFTRNNFAAPISLAPDAIPHSISESDTARLIGILGPLGLSGQWLDATLICAVRQRNVQLVKLSIKHGAGLRKETISTAVSLAFNLIEIHGKHTALEILELLLQKGATGLPVHQTLLAAVKQDQKDVVILLLEHGADANYADGAAFGVALATSNLELLKVLCASCQLSTANFKAGFPLAISPQCYSLEALELLIDSSLIHGSDLNTLWASRNLRSNPNAVEITLCFLRHGMDVDFDNGSVLSYAIKEKNTSFLEKALLANPSINSLTAAFGTAIHTKPRSLELRCMNILLEKAESNEIGQKEALPKEIDAARSGDFAGLQLLIRHRAKVDPKTSRDACLITASSTLSPEDKMEVFDYLLGYGGSLSLEGKSQLLVASVKKHSGLMLLPEVLLRHGAVVGLETLTQTVKIASFELIGLLISKVTSSDILMKTFRHARQIAMDTERRYYIYQSLLIKGVSGDEVSKALLSCLTAENLSDLSFPKLLLEKGASPVYRDGEPFSRALTANSFPAVKLMIQYLVDDNMANIAFRAVTKSPSLQKNLRTKAYHSLLSWNIDEPSLSSALIGSFRDSLSVPDITFLRLLLAKGADPNTQKGQCFASAAKVGAVDHFRALSKCADRNVVIETLLENFLEAEEIVRWFKICIDECQQVGRMKREKLLFLCMQRFPKEPKVLKLLLNQGLSPSAKMNHSLCSGWKPEPCTALLWALFAKPRIHNSVILELLSRGSAALPAYSTPVTKVSAAFVCLLDKARFEVLQCLLELDRDSMLGLVVPGSSLGYLSTYPKTFEKDSGFPRELDLREACLYLGNFPAFRSIEQHTTPDDGTLHLAALLALPNFVTWLLLRSHNPNHKEETYDNMVPLAVVCASQPQPWCKIANEESSWKQRQKETMRILAQKTDLGWRDRNRTILHCAMESGLNTTKAIAEAIEIEKDPDKDEKYLYVDRAGIEYSPQQYVKRILGLDSEVEKAALILYLDSLKLRWRYPRRVLPYDGQQPSGYYGLPDIYERPWLKNRI